MISGLFFIFCQQSENRKPPCPREGGERLQIQYHPGRSIREYLVAVNGDNPCTLFELFRPPGIGTAANTLSLHHPSSRTRLCACGHSILATWMRAALWHSGARLFWRKQCLAGTRADTHITPSSTASVPLLPQWPPSQVTCRRFRQRPACAATVSTPLKSSPNRPRRPSPPRTGSFNTNGITSWRSCVCATLRGSKSLLPDRCPKRTPCFSQPPAMLPNGKSCPPAIIPAAHSAVEQSYSRSICVARVETAGANDLRHETNCGTLKHLDHCPRSPARLRPDAVLRFRAGHVVDARYCVLLSLWAGRAQ